MKHPAPTPNTIGRDSFAEWYAAAYAVDPVQAPRYGPRRDPSYRTEGSQIAKVARALGFTPMHHQRYIIDVATEYTPAGGYKYTDVYVILPRRAGKTTIVNAVNTFRAMKYPGTSIFYTAQTGKDARKRFKEFLDIWQQSPLAEFGKSRLAAGQESLQLLPNGSSIDVFAPTPKALHGDEGHLAGVDEFWTLSQQEGESLQGNITATQTTLSPWAQTWWFSTVGTMESEFMNSKIDEGRAGVSPRVCYIECSLDESADPDDPANWEWHPALGHTITIDALKDARRRVTGAEWKRAYMNQRPQAAEMPLITDWDTLDTDHGAPAGEIAIAYEVGTQATYSAIVAAWYDTTGRPNIRVLRQAPGLWWLPEAITELAGRLDLSPAQVIADGAGPARQITDQLVQNGFEPTVLTMAERSIADAVLLTAARDDRTLVHDGTPALAAAVSLARTKTTNGTETINRDRSAGPVPALLAASMALYGAGHPDTPGIGVF